MKYVATLFLVVGLIAGHMAEAAKVYTWTDKNGTVHYGERPPKDVNASLIHARTGHSAAEPAAEAPAATPPTQAGSEGVMTQNTERCAQAKHNLDALKTYSRIKVKDENGEMRVLTEEEKNAKIANMQKIADESC